MPKFTVDVALQVVAESEGEAQKIVEAWASANWSQRVELNGTEIRYGGVIEPF